MVSHGDDDSEMTRIRFNDMNRKKKFFVSCLFFHYNGVDRVLRIQKEGEKNN